MDSLAGAVTIIPIIVIVVLIFWALVRIVRAADGQARIDETGNAGGRGAYCCPDAACAERALQAGALNRALRTNVNAAARAELRAWAAGLRAPDDPAAARPEPRPR